MKRYLTLFFLLITSLALCAYPEGAINNIDGSALGWDNDNQVWRPIAVDETGSLNTGGATIGSISVDTSNIESYLKKVDGQDTTTITDFIEEIKNCLKVSVSPFNYSVIDRLILIAGEVENLTKTAQPNNFKTARLSSIAASTATQVSPITSGSGANRVFVELRAIDEETEFFIGFDSSVTDSNGRPVKGRILLNMPSSQALYIYHTNASAIDIQQTEGWR